MTNRTLDPSLCKEGQRQLPARSSAAGADDHGVSLDIRLARHQKTKTKGKTEMNRDTTRYIRAIYSWGGIRLDGI